MELFLVIVAILVILGVKGWFDRKNDRLKLITKLKDSYGKIPDKEYTLPKLESIPYYFEHSKQNELKIDDITYNDLNLKEVYKLINATLSSPGSEYLYAMLRKPSCSLDELKERNRVIEFFSSDAEKRLELQILLAKIGEIRNISLYEYLNRLSEVESEKNTVHFIQCALLIASIGVIFIQPVLGIVCTICMFFYNVLSYFKRKAKIENYFSVVSLFLRLIDSSEKLLALNYPEIQTYLSRIDRSISAFSSFRKGAGIVVPQNNSGDIIQGLFDYVKMAFHIDLIKFNNMLDIFKNAGTEMNALFETIGFLDSMIAIASFRESLDFYCIPEFADTCMIKSDELCHPILEEPVGNSFDFERSVLITGSNASGKSTFLKTIGVNQIMAQSIYTVMAHSYKTTFFNVMSSMALTDNLLGGESYYIVEIRSLKRIMDEVGKKIPVLMFIDEVLRGTNTVERIAASSQILADLADSGSLCVAATHDIELTSILEKYYDNYHFEESIVDNRVEFDYRLREGRSTTRNAIKLLGMLGYSNDMIERASEMANYQIESGEWKKL